MPWLHRNGAEIYFEEHGAGVPVLLFAPGFLRSRIERWAGNPERPEVPPAAANPITELASSFRLISMDQRNAGRSRAPIGVADGWATYTADHLALLDHLGVERCHAMGACIGVSFCLALCEAAPERVAAMVLQNPIGLAGGNGPVLRALFDTWAREVTRWPDVDPARVEALWSRMFGGDFMFSVTRDFVARCAHPMLIMPGDDREHPAEVSAELARLAPHAEVVAPWKGPAHHEPAMEAVRAFLVRHTPPVYR